ncbi:unnamed protein product, partial [Laminaria digitata]
WGCSASSLPYPSLSVVERSLLTTAQDAFHGHAKGFEAAAQWTGERLRASQGNARAPHLVCAEYSRGREAISRLEQFLHSPEAVRPVAHSSAHGACFMVTASHAEAQAVSDNRHFGLTSISPFPSALKVAPGVLKHGANRDEASQSPARLATTHGQSMRMGNVQGLEVELSPGTLPAHSSRQADALIDQLLHGLMSESIDLHSSNVWSDPSVANREHLTTPAGALREREWSKAATLVHELSVSGKTSPGDICSWGSISMHQAASDLLLVSGLGHLLYTASGDAWDNEEAAELRVACFMGLVSFLSGRMEVLRIAPRHSKRLLNAVAQAVIQSGTITETPLTAAGLDGTGQVIQVTDTGLDETSCFFIDDDGEEIPHGHYYEELALRMTWSSLSPTSTPTSSSALFQTPSPTSSAPTSEGDLSTLSPTPFPTTATANVFEGGDFSSYPDRRKVIQYIDMIKMDSTAGLGTITTSEGGYFYDIPTDGFQGDDVEGHGTHTAGSALGATLNTPAETTTCSDTVKDPGCVGGCIDADRTSWGDDLLTLPTYYSSFGADIDRICPMRGCDEETVQWCLSDDVGETLTENGGMARGAKLAFFDVFANDDIDLMDYVGNGLWEPCLEAGCKVHSNSWGGAGVCLLTAQDILYDDFMYKNPENLLIFAAGNEGDIDDGRPCTIGSPAISKNVLAVGAAASGETRLGSTSADGGQFDGTNGYADVDTVAFFSSYGPTRDNRVKPEVVAPGDAIYSASSDGKDTHSCRLAVSEGTSMSCPIVAGASAMVRQYFSDASFYVADVTARGWCDDDVFPCEEFSPSSATVKAMLINSANLMGGSSEPDGHRGFGRVHLEMGMPLGGNGSLGLFVVDGVSLPELDSQEFVFDVDADAGLDFRATLCWIDPAATSFAGDQLVHDLDLEVVSPSGTTHIMWASSGEVDTSNVNERVIVAAADVESGTWAIHVSTKGLLTASQRYSLVVNGAIVYSSSSQPFYSDLYSAAPTSSPTGASTESVPSSAGSIVSTPMSLMALVVGAVATTIAASCAV